VGVFYNSFEERGSEGAAGGTLELRGMTWRRPAGRAKVEPLPVSDGRLTGRT
jgi:hypothetical protein